MALDEMNEKYKREEESFQQQKGLYDNAASDLSKEELAAQPFLDGALDALSKVTPKVSGEQEQPGRSKSGPCSHFL